MRKKKNMKPEDFHGEAYTPALNNVKSAFEWRKATFTKKEIATVLTNCGLPRANNFIFEFLNNPKIIKKLERGKYTWASDEPIYYKDLNDVLYNHWKKKQSYNNTAKKSKIEVVEVEEVPQAVIDPVQEHILYLKARGYRIFKPVEVIYEEL